MKFIYVIYFGMHNFSVFVYLSVSQVFHLSIMQSQRPFRFCGDTHNEIVNSRYSL